MARQKTDVLLVRKDAPVQTMRLGPWLLYFFMFLMVLTLAALAGGGYLLYQQNQALSEIVKDNKRLRLSAQNLETIVRGLQDRAFLANMPAEGPPPPPPPRQKKPTQPPKAATPPAEPPQAAQEQPAETDAKAKENGDASTPQEAQAVEPWPTSADWVDVRKVKLKKSGRDLLVYFDINNKLDYKHPAKGYATVLLRSERKGAPWVEAWPPTRLTPLGRPENPKRAAHFAVQRYKRFRARFVLVDKDVEAVEFLIFNEQGELALLMRETMDSKQPKN
ncbi:MAG: hypothetical protein K9L19_01195 [Desulfarculaceae bacterium]|nr:hypothetical protein [Desulfarculaceae bacterium]MCF8046124.1 hypothetical protein [Desulfarculaceae bacterium]MCF8123238.1 hypothetical protein [Desulfarculaceae bacterium]